MQYRIPTVVLAFALIAGCGDTQTDPGGLLQPDLDGASGCFTVRFTVTGQWKGIPWTYNDLDVTGDIEGLVTFAYTPYSETYHGVSFSLSGTAYWTITGGIIPGLGTFETTYDQVNIQAPAKWSNGIIEARGAMRSLSGVEKANLTYKGTGKFPEASWEVDFQGVICP